MIYDILLEDRYEIFHNHKNYYFCEKNYNVNNIDLLNYTVDCICSNITSLTQYNHKEYGIYKKKKYFLIKISNFLNVIIFYLKIIFLKKIMEIILS